MAKYTVVSMPGDGIGNQVLPEAIRVLDAVGFDATYVHGDIGWEFWKSEGNALPDRTIALLEKHKLGLFGAITSKPKKEADAELAPALQRQGLHVLFADRHHAAAVQPGYLRAAVHRVSRQSSELHSQESRRRIRRAAGERGRLPPEHRGAVLRRRVDQPAGAGAAGAGIAPEVQAVRGHEGRGPGGVGADHHAPRRRAHLPRGVSSTPRSTATRT